MDTSQLTSPELLKLHAGIAEELRKRGISRSANNPTGELAEYLFCKAFGWTLAGNSMANIDAVGKDGSRYQIKGRRTTRHGKARQLSAIRDLAGGHFDFLAGILFSEDSVCFVARSFRTRSWLSAGRLSAAPILLAAAICARLSCADCRETTIWNRKLAN